MRYNILLQRHADFALVKAELELAGLTVDKYDQGIRFMSGTGTMDPSVLVQIAGVKLVAPDRETEVM